LITSLRQWESLGWSMLVVQYLTLSCLLAMLAWYREGRYAGAVWMALLLPFLTGNGVLALAAFAAVLLLKPAARLLPAGLVAVLPRLAVGVLLLVLLAMAVVWGRPREVCLYALQMFGGAFIGDRNSSGLLTVLGALNAGLHGYALYRLLGAWRDGNAGRGPLSLMALILFSVMNVYAAIYSRLLVGGIYQPDASRYALFTLLGTVASIIVLSQTVNSGKVMAAIGVFILLVVGAEDVRMLRMAPHQKVFQCNSYRYLSGERPQKEGMAATGLPPHLQQPALDGVAIMRRNKLGFFSEPPRCG
jgi:hypothetical protein